MALEPLKIDIEVNKANFEKQLQGAEKFARDTKSKIDQNMKMQLEFNIVAFQNKLAEVKKQLKAASWDKKINLQIEANQLKRWLTEAKRNLNNLVNTWSQTTSRLQAKFNQLWGWIRNVFKKIWAYMIASFWMYQIWNFFKWAIKEAQDAQRAIAQMNAVIKSTGGTVWLSWKQIRDMAVELSKLTWIEDDVIMASQNMLLTFKNIKWKTFKWATMAVIDMATAMNSWLTPSAEQLSSSSIRLGKALYDPVKWISALTKVWVTFSDIQKEQIKNFMKQWDVASADAVILAELNKEFGGSAQAQMETYWWKVLLLNTQWANFKEQIWNLIIPILISLIWIVSKVIDWISKFISIFDNSAKSLWQLSEQFDNGTISMAKYVEKKWELIKKIEDNRQTLDKLNQKYIM